MNVYPTFNDALLRDLKAAGYRRIALQVPAGLVREAADLGRRIEEQTGAKVVHLNRACFGACDPPSLAESAKSDALVTLGHAPIPNMEAPMPEYYVEMRYGGGNARAVAELIRPSLPQRMGLVASIQHMDLLEPLASALEGMGAVVKIGKGGARLAYAGQALGCNYTTAIAVESEVDCFLFLGTGMFHPIGLALSVSKPVWAIDPLQLELNGPLDRESIISKRLMTIAKAMDARRWGVLVSTFPGQMRRSLAGRLVEKAREKGREATVISFDRLDPRDLTGRPFDAYVSTACPRIAIDDGGLYEKPMLTPQEFLSAISERPLTPYMFDTYV